MDMLSNDSKMLKQRLRLHARYAQAQDVILSRQDPVTGLLPASTAVTVHGDYAHAWVRDNVYSTLAVWGLQLAYRRIDEDRAGELRLSVEKLMRGLLAAMLKQADKVERFKHTQNPLDAVHAKFDPRSGDPVVGDDQWGHLQIDATALYVLMLAQMTKSGLHIVRTRDEVDFIQNLVHYLSRAYRTPDYGIWERGHKRNDGVAEVNASSVGMAKAALEAIQGCSFLPRRAPAIHVQADDIARARNTLEGLLPRESESKETDAALLSVIGFPAFAVEDPDLIERTHADIIAKLQGRYGCKRFLRDGHQSVLEDPTRLHYQPGELRQFEHIESEWPLFFGYLLLNALMRGDAAQAQDYRSRLDGLLLERDGQHLLPELYYVPQELIEAERACPHSQQRAPNENVPLVWAQSLYWLGVLLQERFIRRADLDPLGRRLRSRRPNDVCVQVALLAEDDIVQARLGAQGVVAECPDSVLPLRLSSANELETALCELGRNAALGLSGRPAHGLGTLTTSRVFDLHGEMRVVVPPFLDCHDSYLDLDNRLLVEQIKAEIAYLHRHWRQAGQPLLALQITDPMLSSAGADVLVQYLKELQQGHWHGVRVDRLAALLPGAACERIDWLEKWPGQEPARGVGGEVEAAFTWDEAATRPLSAERQAALQREPDSQVLLRQLAKRRNPYEQIEILGLLWQRHGAEFEAAQGRSVRQLVEAIYSRARRIRLWGIIRRAAAVLEIHDQRLGDAVAEIVGRQKRVTVGRAYSAESMISRTLTTEEIGARLSAPGAAEPRARVLIQEIVLYLGMLIKAQPDLFKGTLTLRAWHLLLLVTGWLAREHELTQHEAFEHLLELSPHAVLCKLREALESEPEVPRNLARLQSLHHADGNTELAYVSFSPSNDPILGEDHGGWSVWREMTGVLTRLPDDFFSRVWELLHRIAGLVIGNPLDACSRMDSAAVLADMTAAEASFALQVEDLLNRIQEPAYRQLTIEALLALSDIARANPDLVLNGDLALDAVIATAVRLAWQETHPEEPSAEYEERLAEAWRAFYESPPHRVANCVMAAISHLLHARNHDA